MPFVARFFAKPAARPQGFLELFPLVGISKMATVLWHVRFLRKQHVIM